MTSVRVPVRVELDLAALRQEPDEVERAVASALTTVLARSASEVLAERPYASTRLTPPRVLFTGDGVRHAGPEELAAVEQRVRMAVDTAWATFQVPDDHQRPVSREPAAEPVDVVRRLSPISSYLLPSYADRGAPMAIGLLSGPRQTTLADVPVRYRVIRTAAEASAALDAELAARARPTRSGQAGVLFSGASGGYVVWIKDLATGEVLLDTGFSATFALRVSGSKAEPVDEAFPVPVDVDHFRMTYAGGAATVAPTLENALLDWLRRRLEGRQPALSKGKIDHLMAAARPRFHRRVLERTAGAQCILRLVGGGQERLIYMPKAVTPTLDAEVYPVLEDVLLPLETTEGDGSGGGSEASTEDDQAGPRPWPLGPRSLVDSGPPLDTTCRPIHENEPALAQLGRAGAELRRRMDAIAAELNVPTCAYLGCFLAYAIASIGARAGRVGASAAAHHGRLVGVPTGQTGNLGPVTFNPGVSAEVEALRRLGNLVVRLDDLAGAYRVVLLHHEPAIERAPHVALHVTLTTDDAFDRAVATMFVQACRILFLDLLGASRRAIEGRLKDPEGYATAFEVAVLPVLEHAESFRLLGQRLERCESGQEVVDPRVDPIAGTYVLPERQLDAGVADETADGGAMDASDGDAGVTAVPGEPGYPQPAVQQSPWPDVPIPPERGGVERRPDGVLIVHDGRGHVYTKDELDQARRLTLAAAESFEPLLKQFLDLPEMMGALRDPERLRSTLAGLLATMQSKNVEIARKAREDDVYAFGRSSISKRLPPGSSPIRYQLHGLHQMADASLSSAFPGCPRYASGVERLFASKAGAESLLGVLEFVGVTALAVLCPPLGAVAGLALAGLHYAAAKESENVYRALVTPERVKSWAEVDAELWAARLGLALAVFAVAAEVAVAARTALKASSEALAKGASATAARAAGRTAVREAIAEATQKAAKDFLGTYIKALAVGEALNLVLGAVLQPLVEHLVAVDLEGGPTGISLEGVDRYLADYEAKVNAELAAQP